MRHAIFAIIILIGFAHYPFTDTMAEAIAWFTHDITILLLACLWTSSLDFACNPHLKLTVVIFTIWRAFVTAFNAVEWSIPFAWWFIAIEAAVFTAWLVKTFLMMTVPESDEYNPHNYMIGIAPYRVPLMTTLNSLLPQTKVICGGRIIVGGEWMWLSRGGKFKRLKIDKSYLKTMILLDTGKPVNRFTDSNLNKQVGKRNWYIFHNCKALDVGVDISHLVRKNERV